VYVALDKAIRDRLEGNPRDRMDNPVDPVGNPGLRYPIYNRQQSIKDKQFNPFGVVPNQWRQVPIFKRSSSGEDWDGVFPCCTYKIIAFNQNSEVWLPPVSKNKIKWNEGTPIEIRNAQGEVIKVGYPTNVTRPLPEGFNILVQIELRSKIEYEAMSMLHSLYNVFPQRGYLKVAQADGSLYTCDMEMMGDTEAAVPEVPAVEGVASQQGDFREHVYITTYLVEGYQDTTWAYLQDRSGVPIQQVDLEMTFPDMPEADNLTTLEGVLEVIDLKKLM